MEKKTTTKMSRQNTVVVPTKEQLMSRETNVKCTQDGCSKTFVHKGALKMHLVKSHKIVESQSDYQLLHKGTGEEMIKLQYHCPQQPCRYMAGSQRFFTSFSALKQHYVKVHAERKYICLKCSAGFGMERSLAVHLETCGVMYSCGTCSVKYSTKEALLMHCKRSIHIYPTEYQRKTKTETQTQKRKRGEVSPETIVMNIIQPLVLVAVGPVLPAVPKRLPPLQPKTTSTTTDTPQTADSSTSSTVPPHIGIQHSFKHDALIQTDIYGVDTLACSQKPQTVDESAVIVESTQLTYNTISQYVDNNSTNTEQVANINHVNNLYCMKDDSFGNGVGDDQIENGQVLKGPTLNSEIFDGEMQKGQILDNQISHVEISSNSPSKRQPVLKRKSSYIINSNLSSPRRKKLKSTTGMQTSVSLTRKRGTRIVNSTQTTGDFILQTAMKEANIQIQKKTVASQVTPQKEKPGKDCKLKSSEIQTFLSGFKPHLVDSSSQVYGNIVESETMTEQPLSTSTQTLQSFLEGLQEKTNQKIDGIEMINSNATNLLNSDTNFTNNSSDMLYTDTNFKSTKATSSMKSVVNIYNETLDKSVSFQMPENLDVSSGSERESSGLNRVKINQEEVYTAVKITDIEASTNNTTRPQEQLEERMFMRNNKSLFEQSFVANSTAKTDMEAQAMSAVEFDQLLHSSGIFLSNDNFFQGAVRDAPSTTDSSHQTNLNQNSTDLDFLSVGTSTMDMNTQTGTELNLFDHYVSIDSNTQTQADVDFLDLMTNMETQTLNDEDLVSLGLLENNLKSNNVHNMSVGTSDMDFNSTSFPSGNPAKAETINLSVNQQSVSQPISPNALPSHFKNSLTETGSLNQASDDREDNQSTWTSLCNQKQTAQMETQTPDLSMNLLQIENQTQVDLADTGLVAVNIQTQTTFDELEEFCELLK